MFLTIDLRALLIIIIIIILWAGVQPTLDPYAEAFYSRPIALTLGGEEFRLMMYASVCVTVGRVG